MIWLVFIATISIVGGAKVPMEDAKDATLQPSVLFEKHQAPTRLLRLGEPPGRPQYYASNRPEKHALRSLDQ